MSRGVLQLTLAVAALTALIWATSAPAAVYQGVANDGPRVSLHTNASGVPTRVEFGDYDSTCSNGYSSRNAIPGFEDPFDDSSTQIVIDKGHRTVRRDVENVGRANIEVRWNLIANLTDSNRWRGKFKTTGVFTKHGEELAKCTARFDFVLSPR
jgi:hypothetical protein